MTGHDLMYRRQRLADGPWARFWIKQDKKRNWTIARWSFVVIAIAFGPAIILGVLS